MNRQTERCNAIAMIFFHIDCVALKFRVRRIGFAKVNDLFLFLFHFEYLLVDVVHHFIVATASVDFWNDSWSQSVHQFAQDNTIAKSLFICNWWETFSNDCFNPTLSFELLLWVTFSSNLKCLGKYSFIFICLIELTQIRHCGYLSVTK